MRGKLNRNIYMGPFSTAQIPVHNKVDTSHEILLNIFATGYDALNNIMLTRRPGFFDKTTIHEINGRFGILRMLAGRHSPRVLTAVNGVHAIVVDNYHGKISALQALHLMREICLRYNVDPGSLNEDFSLVMVQIDNAEQLQRQSKPVMFPFWMQPSQNKKNKNNRRMIF